MEMTAQDKEAQIARMQIEPYDVIDLQTGSVVTTCKGLRRASASAERRNQRYGAHRFTHKRQPAKVEA